MRGVQGRYYPVRPPKLLSQLEESGNFSPQEETESEYEPSRLRRRATELR